MAFKKLIINTLAATVVGLASTASMAGVCTADIHIGNHFVGNTKCGPGSISDVNVLGNLYTNNTAIQNSLKVIGVATLSGGSVANANIDGDGHFSSVVMKGLTQLTGKLDATTTTFKGELKIDSPDITLKNTVAQNIDVTDMTNPVDDLYLDGSHVNGNITFDSGKGEVFVKDGTVISGSVIGGKIIRQ